jgi:integrase
VRPKAYKPRVAPLTQELSDALRAHLANDPDPNPHRLLWHRADGKPLTNQDSNDAFREAIRLANITRPATTHWLRHTYTTMAEHAGIPWVVYVRISGHGSEDISRKYTHQLEQDARSGIATLAAYLSPPQR